MTGKHSEVWTTHMRPSCRAQSGADAGSVTWLRRLHPVGSRWSQGAALPARSARACPRWFAKSAQNRSQLFLAVESVNFWPIGSFKLNVPPTHPRLGDVARQGGRARQETCRPGGEGIPAVKGTIRGVCHCRKLRLRSGSHNQLPTIWPHAISTW